MSEDIETNAAAAPSVPTAIPGHRHGADDKPCLRDLQYMSYTGEDGRDVLQIRLMQQVRPHWRALAIAFDFPEYEIAIMEKKDDPVYYLFSEWLRGGRTNQEKDPRLVTWETLIEALRHAGIQEEATVLEKHFLLVPVTRPNAAAGVMMHHGSITVTVHPDVPKSLLSLMKAYAEMLVVLRLTKLPKEKFTELTFFLSGYCQLDEDLICVCSSLSNVIRILQQKLKIWIFNIDTLIAIKGKFNSSKAASSIEQYRQHLTEFRSSTSVREFEDALKVHIDDPSHAFESIILKLDEVRTNDTLQHLEKLVYDIFGIRGRALVLIKIGMGCVCVTWLVPTSLVSTMRAIAEQRSERYLTNLGVLELVIGLRVVPNEERFTVGDSYRKMIGAMNQEIQKLKSKNEELKSKLKAVHNEKSDYKEKCERQEAELKEKSDYEEMCEQQEAELKAMLKEKSDYEKKYEQQEAELKAVLKEKSDYKVECEQKEIEAKEVEKQTFKNFEREKKAPVLQEESKDHIDAIMAGSSATNIELDIASDAHSHADIKEQQPKFASGDSYQQMVGDRDQITQELKGKTGKLEKFDELEGKVFQVKGSPDVVSGTPSSGSSPAAEPEALKHLFSYLVNSIDTAALLPAALSKGLITERQRSECYHEADPYKKAETFLGYLQRAVNADYENYYTFVQILKETGQRKIGSRLRDELTHSIRSMQPPSASSSTDEGEQVELVPDSLVEELARLRCAFAKLIRNYEKKLLNSPEAQQELVAFLQRLFDRAVEDHSFQSHFNAFVEEEVSLFNILYLKELCDIYPEDVRATTRQLVEEYEQLQENFVTSATVSQFKQLFLATATPSKLVTGKAPIKCKLKNRWGSKTLQDLKQLVALFGVSGKCLHLSKVEDGCIAVTWLCSTSEVKQLKMAITDNAESLQTKGVLQVFVGEELVLECTQSDPSVTESHKPVTVHLLPQETDIDKVRCSDYEEGCEWVGELRDLHDHHDPAKEQCCPFGCNKYACLSDMKKHTDDCHNQKISCENCGYYNTLTIVKEQHYPICPQSTQTAVAPASASSQFLMYNLAPIEFIIGDFSEKKQANKEWLSAPFYTHNRDYKFRLKVYPNGICDSSGSHLSVHVVLMSGKQPFEGDIQIELLNWREDKNHHSATICFNSHNYTVYRVTSQDTATRNGQPDQFISHRDLAPTTNTRYLLGDFFKLRVSVAIYSTPPSSLTPKWMMGAAATPLSSHDDSSQPTLAQFMISEFSKRKEFNNMYFSPPFTTSPQGYKFSIKVMANGCKSGKGTNITISAMIMKGQHDEHLKWPFTGTIIIEVLNWLEDKEHFKQVFSIDPNDGLVRVKVNEGEYGNDFGFFKFISHVALPFNESTNTQYLYEDCICVRVRKSRAADD